MDITDGEGRTPLLAACFNEMSEVAKLVQERGTDVNTKDLCDGKYDVAKVLMEGGAEVARGIWYGSSIMT